MIVNKTKYFTMMNDFISGSTMNWLIFYVLLVGEPHISHLL